MEGGRRLAVGVVGVAVMFLAAGLMLRMAGGKEENVGLDAPPSSIDVLTADPGEVIPGAGIEPGLPPQPLDPSVPPGLDVPAATLPAPGVATIPLPQFDPGATTGPGPGATTSTRGPAFTEKGVWVVKSNGTSPILVARDATSGVAAGGTWVAFVEGTTVRAVRRSDLRAKVDLATGVSGSAASGLPIAGGGRGVAFLQGGRAVLVDPAAPAQPAVSHEAPGAEAVAAEEDGDGRLVWADAAGLHLGVPESTSPADHVQRGILVMGHGVLAHLQGGLVAVRNGPRLAWGEVDRLQTGPAGMVAASGGRIRFRTTGGEERTLLDRASTPVVTGSKIFYVSQGQSLASATLTGTGATTVATAGAGRSITNLDLLDDSTLVVTIA